MQQREIKFRAWDQGNERFWDACIWMGKDWALRDDCPTGFPVTQYTGLKDKNGVGIYEGDILRSVPTMKLDDTIIISVVEFDQRRGMWVANSVKYDEVEYLFEATKPYHETVIIGNIYQNPELIPS